MLTVEYLPLDQIKPYAGNAKMHPAHQIEQIKESIQQFGFNDPLALWRGEIVEGHGRYIAAQELGLSEIPVIRLDGLTDEQRRAYSIVHNKLTMNSDFDVEQLTMEIESLEDIDLAPFSLNFEESGAGLLEECQHEKDKQRTKERTLNIVNLGKGQFQSVGFYDIPVLQPVFDLPPIKEWIGFNYVLSDKNPDGKAVHFFIDDYQFERIWSNPEKYVEKLKQYVCVATPDFSPYGDMPHILQIYNHYRKHWVGAFLQNHGVTIIPTIRCSTDERSLDWYLEGTPKNGIVIMSSMWTGDNRLNTISKKEYATMLDKLKPTKIFVYGKDTGNMGVKKNDPVEYIPSFTEKRYQNA